MRIHFIAIGGSAMHNLALAMHDAGHNVTGSDDQILEPSRSRLEQAGLLPSFEGWEISNISSAIDVVILGMHARPNNPELLRAQDLGVSVQSYPEFLFQATQNQKRIVIGGSHGKTTITSMLLHVLKQVEKRFNYMVGAQLDGFDRMVSLDPNVDLAIFEGDEYLSSPIDRRPKFFWYQAHITLITGIAWDHINVFPTEAEYIHQFAIYLTTLAPNATVIWCAEDPHLPDLIAGCDRSDLQFIPYYTPEHKPTASGRMEVQLVDGHTLHTELVGSHNIQNLSGARHLAESLGISNALFDEAIANFSGASRRLEIVEESARFVAFRDFAHAPSKLKATTAGVKASYPEWDLTACFELHTFSSLNPDFLPSYQNALEAADHAIVYFDPEVLQHKNLPALDPEFIRSSFGNHPHLQIITSSADLKTRWESVPRQNHAMLMMSSGWFSGTVWEPAD